MATHKSAAKASRQADKRRERNRAGKSRLRTSLKKYRALLAEGSADAQGKLSEMLSLIDVSAKHGFIHRNVANRLKSKLTRQASAVASA